MNLRGRRVISWPSETAMGGLWSEFGPIRVTTSVRTASKTSSPGDDARRWRRSPTPSPRPVKIALALSLGSARVEATASSETAQNLSKNHPRAPLMDTSRVSEVKAPRDAAIRPSSRPLLYLSPLIEEPGSRVPALIRTITKRVAKRGTSS